MIPVLHGVWSAGGVVGDYEHIETVTVGAGGTASVTFSSIAGTYKHLQIRGLQIPTAGTNGNYIEGRINSDSGTNYAYHTLSGNGITTKSAAATTQNKFRVLGVETSTENNAYPQIFVMEILDYANTSKNKTTRTLAGGDGNGKGEIGLMSGLWMSTSAVTSVSLLAYSQGLTSTFGQHSTFALYGVK